ncbi:hypothetical protein ACTOB_005282 [Actinoplanes oblitus]|uniref:Uncharacterized protein n=1 Tax=Actinoplanes oblitus TaxID=3040509 RepID=A0ABY8W737_9ACTN|nr:hypothetical protein [Actinoplanes oblitus]WIM93307.1 hypothetical protein ACTOB_005282 [Actinoplanes oblitus]
MDAHLDFQDLPLVLRCRTVVARRRRGAVPTYRELLLARWVRECAWDGGGTAALTWIPLASAEPDAVIAVRDLIAAAIGGLGTARSRRIVTERLGLHGDAARTLQALG